MNRSEIYSYRVSFRSVRKVNNCKFSNYAGAVMQAMLKKMQECWEAEGAHLKSSIFKT